VTPATWALAALSSPDLAALAAAEAPLAVLVPVGSVEPHGPHLALGTDTVISEASCARAAELLAARGVVARVAPAVPYGVTECSRAFCGAVSIPAAALTAYLRAVVAGFLATGVDHVCLVNNHLEPAHDAAVRAAAEGHAPGAVSVACPLTRRHARTLSEEFKSGACHAGRYETSLILAAAPDLVNEARRAALPEVAVSLSQKLREGIDDFAAMGLAQAYAGAPAQASREEGQELLERLAGMVVTEVSEGLARAGERDPAA
jgi:creatinine amidohydrolase